MRRFPSIPDIEIDDLIDGFNYLDPSYRFVRLGAGVLVAPHSDPFIHPNIVNLIKYTAEHFRKKTVTTVTTGSHITPNHLSALQQISNYGIDLSLITMQASRERLMAYSTREKMLFLLREGPIRKISLMFTGSVEELEQDLDLLASLGLFDRVEEILVRRMENIDGASNALRTACDNSIENYPVAAQVLRERWPQIKFTIPYLSSEYWHARTEYFNEADARIEVIRNRIEGDCTTKQFWILTPDSSFAYFSNALTPFPQCAVHRVPNRTFGGSVTVSGLLTNNDFSEVLSEAPPTVTAILPMEAFDKNGDDLFGISFRILEEKHKCHIELM
ncbi:MAG TPA: DUF512 domain-containing protein [bacterium]|nr:DUF512 domain-containing protein [bacterium]